MKEGKKMVSSTFCIILTALQNKHLHFRQPAFQSRSPMPSTNGSTAKRTHLDQEPFSAMNVRA